MPEVRHFHTKISWCLLSVAEMNKIANTVFFIESINFHDKSKIRNVCMALFAVFEISASNIVYTQNLQIIHKKGPLVAPAPEVAYKNR